jgi:hypothetical protein
MQIAPIANGIHRKPCNSSAIFNAAFANFVSVVSIPAAYPSFAAASVALATSKLEYNYVVRTSA